MAKCGIYKIENLITHHIYIGQSTNIDTRWRRHKDDVHSGKKDYPLYRAINKYGIDNFSFEIIEECSKEALDEREQFWIKYYNSYKNGYNQTIGGQGAKCCGSSLNYKQVETIREELRKTCKTNIEIANEYDELYQLLKDNNGNLYKMDGNAIRKWCISYGIPFHSKDYRPPKEEKIKQPNPALPKPVAKLDLNTGEILETYSSIEEAQKINHVFHVGRVCSGGFGWKFI